MQQREKLTRHIVGAILLSGIIGWTGPAAVMAEPAATVELSAGGLSLNSGLNFERLALTVSGPDGFLLEKEFKPGSSMFLGLLDQPGVQFKDGSYHYELKVVPRMSAEQRVAMIAARAAGSELPNARQDLISTGTFAVVGGQILLDNRAEEITPKDIVHADDVIIQGSLCVGFDCVNNESFGFDTIRLKENSTRIKFEDTSVGSFPTNDWQLTANDSASGGQSKFSIEDITGAKVPFTVTAGASTNSIFVDSSGRVGFRTSTPVLDLHVSTSNTPALRLEQTSAGGFTAQTWDIAGNEANFFVRDVTSGSKLPFRIRPGAPTSSIDISASGDVGIGTASPSAHLHIFGSSGSSEVKIEDTGTLETALILTTGGVSTRFQLDNITAAGSWSVAHRQNDNFAIIRDGSGGNDEFNIEPDGDVLVNGVVVHSSSRTVKENFAPVDPQTILDRVAKLPLAEWTYQRDAQKNRHLGPMAEDFWATFGLGPGDRQISDSDTAGVALAAIQGLYQLLQQKDAELARLTDRLTALEAEKASAP